MLSFGAPNGTPAQNIMAALGTGSQVMTPGGGGTGAPPQAPPFQARGQLPPMGARLYHIPALLQALQGWRAGLPQGGQQMPFANAFSHLPQMTPGGGGTGAPIQGSPAPQTNTIPQVGTSMGVNGAIPASSPYGLPSY